MYIKVYIFWMEMSYRIHFWYRILLKMMFFFFFFLENGKKITFLVKKFYDKLKKIYFWVQNAKIAWKLCQGTSLRMFFPSFKLRSIFENFDSKGKNHDFLAKKSFWHFLVKIFKNIA